MSQQSYNCPKCDGSNFKRWELPHPLVLHWVLNPGLAINEIILGQRLPKTQLICQECEGPLVERGYVPCPSCGESIPCIWNVFSLLILCVTFPLWALPYFFYFRKQPLRPLFQLEDGQPPTPKAITGKTWIILGASWGTFMWLFKIIFPVLVGNGGAFSWRSALTELSIWALGGFVFGFFMWFFLGCTPKQSSQDEQE